jgi:hypothetical protein
MGVMRRNLRMQGPARMPFVFERTCHRLQFIESADVETGAKLEQATY